jgi:AraC family transcriptional regulator, regulatory protein of adaptative response / methylated-DNA-[protein]-cysteine methyltransferase
MNTQILPDREEMMKAFLERDSSYQGIFFTGVRSTGIFCRIGCPARTPRPEQLEFFPTAGDALFAGFRPCKRCRPIEPASATPTWLRTLLEAIDQDPETRWSDSDIRALRLHPDRVRRWFQKHHGMTFHAYARARRLGVALDQIRRGSSVVGAALDNGYDSLSGFNEAFRVVLGKNPTQASQATILRVIRLTTPLGPMIACATDRALCMLEFADRRMLELQLRRVRKRLKAIFLAGSNAILERTAGELDEYFAGNLREFTIPINLAGSEFQTSVWKRLQDIPYGRILSYRDVAVSLNAPNSVRAVGRANGDNCIAIIVPCHRVVGSNGHLTGYGGGLWRKRRLLEIETSSESRVIK